MKRYIEIIKNTFSIVPDKKLWVVELVTSNALYNIASLLPPIATAGIIGVLSAKNFAGIWVFVVLYLVFYAAYFLGLYWNYNIFAKLGDYYHVTGKKKIFAKISTNEEIFDKVSKGKIIDTCSSDVDYIIDTVDAFTKIVIGIIKLVIIFFIFAYYNIFAAIIAFLVDFAYLKLMNDNSKVVSKHYENTRKSNDRIMDIVNQLLLNIKQVKSLNLMPSIDKKIDKELAVRQKEYRLRRVHLTNRYSKIPIIIYLGKIFLYIFLGYLVCQEKMALDILVLLISYFEMTMTNTDTLLENLLNLSNYGVRINRIKLILDAQKSSIYDFGDLENDYITGLVEFKNVSCKIKNNLVLNNVSFKLYPNAINTIVGPAGSGKTTVFNLLYRNFRINKGNIYIDDENIYDYSSSIYNNNVSGVFQKPFVFDMSIKDNLGLVNSNKEEQIEVCKKIGIHEQIINFPNGYNTKMEENNPNIDDNFKQMLMVARAILSKAEILLFDEVTSNLDDETAEKIEKIIIDLKKDHTICLITHKPEFMNISDRIIVLDKGKVVAKGPNSEVSEKCELYKELKAKQFVTASIIDE